MAKTIVVGISGGIAAQRRAELLLPILKKNGHTVEVILTESALHMVDVAHLQRLSDAVHTKLFPTDFDYKQTIQTRDVRHLDIAHRADLLVIVPATANTIAKLAHGIADNLLTLVALATRAPILFCPGMNERMWLNVATQENVATLEKRGFIRVGPRRGPMLDRSLPEGVGAGAEINSVVTAVEETLLATAKRKE